MWRRRSGDGGRIHGGCVGRGAGEERGRGKDRVCRKRSGDGE